MEAFYSANYGVGINDRMHHRVYTTNGAAAEGDTEVFGAEVACGVILSGMRIPASIVGRLLAAFLLLSAATASAGDSGGNADRLSSWHWSDVERVVVIPDIHGAYDQLVSLLRATGLIDETLAWTGGETHLISLGDLLDRGDSSRKVMDLLIRLQEEAPAAGGWVHVVIGNHEHMNLTGDLRYVSTGEFGAFAAEESEQLRELARADFVARHPEMSAEEQVAAFTSRYPPGYFAHRAAFRPDGEYGRWLLTLPTVIVVNETAFVHGGLPRKTADWSAAQLNAAFSRDLSQYLRTWRKLVTLGAIPDDEPESADAIVTDAIIEDPSRCIEQRALACEKIEGNGEVLALMSDFNRLSRAAVNVTDSPFWYRGSVYCRDILERPILEDYLDTLGANRVVVGHTPTMDRRVRVIRDGKVIMTDTGMLVSYYEGRPAALIMEDGEITVQYVDPDERRPPETGFGPVAYGLDSQDLERALREGTIKTVDRESSPESWQISLVFEGQTVPGRFFPDGRRGSADEEFAAHTLDGLLGTELVAPTVRREVEGTDGALQLVYPGEISEQRRVEGGLGFYTGWCSPSDQFQLMYAFDLLTANAGRTAANIVYSRPDWTLRLTGHGSAFGSTGKLPEAIADGAITLAPGLEAALRRLDRETLESALGEYIGKRRVRALLSRRDELLQRFGH